MLFAVICYQFTLITSLFTYSMCWIRLFSMVISTHLDISMVLFYRLKSYQLSWKCCYTNGVFICITLDSLGNYIVVWIHIIHDIVIVIVSIKKHYDWLRFCWFYMIVDMSMSIPNANFLSIQFSFIQMLLFVIESNVFIFRIVIVIISLYGKFSKQI